MDANLTMAHHQLYLQISDIVHNVVNKDPDVKAYAQRMFEDNSVVNRENLVGAINNRVMNQIQNKYEVDIDWDNFTIAMVAVLQNIDKNNIINIYVNTLRQMFLA